MLPAQNATGNWVKVVQRVPVRLELLDRPEGTLLAGLSADVEVDTKSSAAAPGRSPSVKTPVELAATR